MLYGALYGFNGDGDVVVGVHKKEEKTSGRKSTPSPTSSSNGGRFFLVVVYDDDDDDDDDVFKFQFLLNQYFFPKFFLIKNFIKFVNSNYFRFL